MQLLEDGDVDLDAPVARFLPRALAGHATAGAITLRQLLSHTSGLVADHIDGAETPDSSLRKQAASVLAEDLVSRPGSTFSYSNSGYSLVGYVIEAVAGRSWWDTMQSYLFDPCDLDLAFIGDPRDGAQQASVVTGHAVDSSSGAAVPVDFYCEHTMAPAGGLAASASTLVSFARSFMVSSDRRADAPVAAEPTDDSLSGKFKRWYHDLLGAGSRAATAAHGEFTSLVKIRRIDEPDRYLLGPDQKRSIRQGLRLQLLSARINLLNRNEALFRQDLAKSVETIQRFFDVEKPEVKSSINLLTELQSEPLQLKLPTLSDSMAAPAAARAESGNPFW